ncbi:MAG: S-methyl-5-thioribose-1-phosphate isomerase, partial [Desulfosalsimonas sp.]
MSHFQKNPARPIWEDPDTGKIYIIDQRKLPRQMVVFELADVDDVIFAICDMMVRGAPLIGVTGAYGVYLAFAANPSNPDQAAQQGRRIRQARPTAVNLAWAVDQTLEKAMSADKDSRAEAARTHAAA